MKITIDIPESLDLETIMRAGKLRMAMQQTWDCVKPERKFYEEGRRRVRWPIDTIGGVGDTYLNILIPNPDDAHGSWQGSMRVTWQQIEDEEPPT